MARNPNRNRRPSGRVTAKEIDKRGCQRGAFARNFHGSYPFFSCTRGGDYFNYDSTRDRFLHTDSDEVMVSWYLNLA